MGHLETLYHRLASHPSVFFLTLFMAILLTGLTQNVQSFLAYFFLLFFPGYLIARLFLGEDWERVIVSIPFSIMAIGMGVYVLSWFTPDVIGWLPIFLVYGLIILITFVVTPARKVTDHFLGHLTVSPWIVWGVLTILLGLSFWVHGEPMDGYVQSYPRGAVSWDKIVHYEWVDSMMETGSVALPPSLHGGDVGVQSVHFTPLSIDLYGLFSRFSGLTYWDATDVLSGLIFASSILLVFGLTNYFWNTRVALLASLVASLPTSGFFFPDLAGMYRVGLSLVLLATLILVLEWTFHQRKGVNYLLGFVLGAVLVVHPVDLVLVIPFILYASYRIWKDRSLIPYYIPSFLIAFTLFIPFALVSSTVFESHYFLEKWELISSVEFEQKSSDLVGPILKINYLLIYLAVSLAGLALVLWNKFVRKTEETSWRWIGMFGVSLLMVSGFHTVLFHYTGKMRSIVYLLLIIPFASYFVLSVIDRIPKLDKRISLLIVVGLIFFMHPPWGFSKVTFETKVDAQSWEVIQWIQSNTQNEDTVYAMYGFFQHAHVLTNRPGNYAGDNTPKVWDYLNGKEETFSPYCVSGYIPIFPFSWSPAPCPVDPMRLEEYDYLLVDYDETPRILDFSVNLEQKLADRGFFPVYHAAEIVVYGRLVP